MPFKDSTMREKTQSCHRTMKCEKCGSEDFYTKWINFPIMVGPESGIIKSVPQPVYKCKKCATYHSSGEKAK